MDEPALDLFMAAISNIEIWKPFLALLVLYVLIFGGFKGRALVFCVGLALLVNSAVHRRVLKKFVDRRRPKQVERVRMVELAKAHPGVSQPLQETEDPLLRCERSQPLRTLLSFRARDE